MPAALRLLPGGGDNSKHAYGLGRCMLRGASAHRSPIVYCWASSQTYLSGPPSGSGQCYPCTFRLSKAVNAPATFFAICSDPAQEGHGGLGDLGRVAWRAWEAAWMVHGYFVEKPAW